MREEDRMDGLNWMPQVKPNNISIESTNRIKPRLLTTSKSKYRSTKEDNCKRMLLYFRILEPNALNTVSQDMNEKIIIETNLPFWYNVRRIITKL